MFMFWSSLCLFGFKDQVFKNITFHTSNELDMSRRSLGPTQPPIQWVPGALSLGVKRLGCETDHFLPSSAEVKNTWSYTYAPPIRLHGVLISYKRVLLCKYGQTFLVVVRSYSLCLFWMTEIKVKLSLCFNSEPRQPGVLGELRFSYTHS
jgi:hypothetical protein